jgi:hypothetical protein
MIPLAPRPEDIMATPASKIEVRLPAEERAALLRLVRTGG